MDSFRARDESEVRGYGELLQTIFDHSAELPLEERFIKQLHGILLKYSEADAWHRGEYKRTPNHVEVRHPDGRVEVVFQTAAPFDTPRRMQELLEATTSALASGESHPLVVIARFIVDFLAIHPFQDGNGRLARALTTLLLHEYAPYASLERVVEEAVADGLDSGLPQSYTRDLFDHKRRPCSSTCTRATRSATSTSAPARDSRRGRPPSSVSSRWRRSGRPWAAGCRRGKGRPRQRSPLNTTRLMGSAKWRATSVTVLTCFMSPPRAP
ncbi:MAG TPA: Fic family protein [Longimicrobiales bacterium]|nr:Fic family protein [Longimicrobiales bacterium]